MMEDSTSETNKETKLKKEIKFVCDDTENGYYIIPSEYSFKLLGNSNLIVLC